MDLNPLLPFIMAGDPSLERLPDLLAEAGDMGIQALELGLPHSDPIADGPVLQAAAQRAIVRGATPRRILESLAGIRQSPDIVLFTYLNPLLQIGAPALVSLLAATPVKALLVVDLPFGEEPEWEGCLRAAGYPVIPLLAPTTGLTRAERLLNDRPDPGGAAPFAQRFAYLVARLGVTGAGSLLNLAPLRQRLRPMLALGKRPLALGFGLSDPTALRQVRALGVTPVVGSALVQELAEGRSLRQVLLPRLVEEP